MGTSLTLVPNRWISPDPWESFLATDRLEIGGNYDLHDAIKELPSQEVPLTARFDWYGDSGIVTRNTDPYGRPLRYMLAGHLARVREPQDLHPYARACMAFVRTLPRDTVIVLWWH